MNDPLTPEADKTPAPPRLSPIASMDELTASEDFPRPDEEAIAAIQQKREAEPQISAPNAPEVFDPSIHAVGKDGKPSITAGGKFRKRKGAQFKKPEESKPVDAAPATSKSFQAAVATSGIIEQLSVALISDEFIYSEIERAGNVKAWDDTYEYYGGVSLYPPLELAASHIAIIVARAHKEKTRPKLAAALAWMKAKLSFKRKKKNGTYTGSRNDGGGENNMGAEKGALVTAN